MVHQLMPDKLLNTCCRVCTGTSGTCKPVTCSQAIKQYCPATPPIGPEAATAADLTGWTSHDCLWALCYSRADQVNLTRCVHDEQNDLTLLSYSYGALNGSSAFTTMLASTIPTAKVQALPAEGPGEWRVLLLMQWAHSAWATAKSWSEN
jgi:hypothetical protein